MNTKTLKQLESINKLELEIRQLEFKHHVGVRFPTKSLSKSVWHWFFVYDMGTENEFITFDHSYNQCTGKVRRGVMTGIRLQVKIDKLFENNTILPDQVHFRIIEHQYGQQPSRLVEYWIEGKGWKKNRKPLTPQLIADLANQGATKFGFAVKKTPCTDYSINELTC